MDDKLDLLVTLFRPEVYRSLVTDRGWPPERFEHWLGDTLLRDPIAWCPPPRSTPSRLMAATNIIDAAVVRGAIS